MSSLVRRTVPTRMHRPSPSLSGTDSTLTVLATLQDPNTKPEAARSAFEDFVYEQLRGGARIRDLLGVIKSMKRQASHSYVFISS